MTTQRGNKNSKQGTHKIQPLPQRETIIAQNPNENSYGDYPPTLSLPTLEWTPICKLKAKEQKSVWIRARIHSIRKKSNKMAFVLLRQKGHSVQSLVLSNEKSVTREMVKYIAKIPTESVVDVFGTVNPTDFEIKSASMSNIEILVEKLFVVSACREPLPFQLDVASNKFKGDEEKEAIQLKRALRLDYRFIDARTSVTNAIFRIQSQVSTSFREFLLSKGFIEIHTPKIVPGVSEGGAEVFRLNYFDSPACLAQSPQLYKQMAISCDFDRVFEIGPVFRAENANTGRHLSEFTGLDFEMAIQSHYTEIIKMASDLFVHIFDQINYKCAQEISFIAKSFPSSPLLYPPSDKTVLLTFEKVVQLLEKAKLDWQSEGKSLVEIESLGAVCDPHKDLSTLNEKLLGRIVKEKYKTDFYIVHRYPKAARPFYTMPCDDQEYTKSYDIFLRGEEITSGAQRIHSVDLLEKRAAECKIPLETLADYLNSFKYGMYPHGGIGIGLERVVMLFLGIDNIRECSLFPRDCKRLSP